MTSLPFLKCFNKNHEEFLEKFKMMSEKKQKINENYYNVSSQALLRANNSKRPQVERMKESSYKVQEKPKPYSLLKPNPYNNRHHREPDRTLFVVRKYVITVTDNSHTKLQEAPASRSSKEIIHQYPPRLPLSPQSTRY